MCPLHVLERVKLSVLILPVILIKRRAVVLPLVLWLARHFVLTLHVKVIVSRIVVLRVVQILVLMLVLEGAPAHVLALAKTTVDQVVKLHVMMRVEVHAFQDVELLVLALVLILAKLPHARLAARTVVPLLVIRLVELHVTRLVHLLVLTDVKQDVVQRALTLSRTRILAATL